MELWEQAVKITLFEDDQHRGIACPHPQQGLAVSERSWDRDFDGVVVPGGYAPDYMRRHESMVRLVRDMHDRKKVVAAICHAGC